MEYLACLLDTIGAHYKLQYGSEFIECVSLYLLKYNRQGLLNKYKYRNILYKEAEFVKRPFVLDCRSKPASMAIRSGVHIYMLIWFIR